MDYGTIIRSAHQNRSSKNESSFYKTKFEPPKKEVKNKTLSTNIQKFLAKKEEEERKKALLARKKRDELIAKRDVKATNKIKKMLKVTKSANKSVLEDAVDNVNTAITMHGPDQPDEDDYGYVSQEASEYYKKLMDKYRNIPEESKFAASRKLVNNDLNGTKDRVRAAIMRQQEEDLSPHKRKRRPDEPEQEEFKETKREDKPKPKRPPMPPPLDFSQLLKIAEKKQFEPVAVESKKAETKEDGVRLMTKKQRREYEEERASREARERRDKERIAALANGKTQSEVKPVKNRIPKLSDKLNKTDTKVPEQSKSRPLDVRKDRPPVKAPVNSTAQDKPKVDRPIPSSRPAESSNRRPETSSPSYSAKSIRPNHSNADVRKNNENRPRPSVPSAKLTNSTKSDVRKPIPEQRPLAQSSKNGIPPRVQPQTSKSNKPPVKQIPGKPAGVERKLPQDVKPRSDVQKPRQFPPSDVRPRQFPPTDVRSRQFPPKDIKKQRLAKRRIMDDDDSEYDSSLEDFIDDGPEEGADVSNYIKEIFGYDKSRYRDTEDDVANMESNFSQVMREEYISKKIGIMEDLEDMRLEAMEKEKKSHKKRRIN